MLSKNEGGLSAINTQYKRHEINNYHLEGYLEKNRNFVILCATVSVGLEYICLRHHLSYRAIFMLFTVFT